MPNVVDSSVLLKTVQTYNPLFERGGCTYVYFPDRPEAYCSMIMSLIHEKQFVDISMFIAQFWGLSMVQAMAVFRKWRIADFIIICDFTEQEKYQLCKEVVKLMHNTVGTKFDEGNFKRGFELYKLIEQND
ncbi:MAG: hypothetical protein UH685_03120 [Bacteroidaceae bacterium]|nr:hypothetical protein [Bacteroidaceae bacterium]